MANLAELKAERGYLIWATNTDNNDYIDCALACAKSIKLHTPDAKISLVSDTIVEHPVIDYPMAFPYASQSTNPLHRDWQVYYASPFRQTIKIEADMIVPHSIDHWWTMLEKKDMVLTIGARNSFNQLTADRSYRKIFDANGLPDVYNAITYWRRSELAMEFFRFVSYMFSRWDLMKPQLKYSDLDPDGSTDVVYALAAKLLGVENFTLPGTTYPSMIHMKGRINGLQTENWMQEMIWELNGSNIRINTIDQEYPFHYVVKDFSKVLNEHYDKLL